MPASRPQRAAPRTSSSSSRPAGGLAQACVKVVAQWRAANRAWEVEAARWEKDVGRARNACATIERWLQEQRERGWVMEDPSIAAGVEKHDAKLSESAAAVTIAQKRLKKLAAHIAASQQQCRALVEAAALGPAPDDPARYAAQLHRVAASVDVERGVVAAQLRVLSELEAMIEECRDVERQIEEARLARSLGQGPAAGTAPAAAAPSPYHAWKRTIVPHLRRAIFPDYITPFASLADARARLAPYRYLALLEPDPEIAQACEEGSLNIAADALHARCAAVETAVAARPPDADVLNVALLQYESRLARDADARVAALEDAVYGGGRKRTAADAAL